MEDQEWQTKMSDWVDQSFDLVSSWQMLSPDARYKIAPEQLESVQFLLRVMMRQLRIDHMDRNQEKIRRYTYR
ncbi:hypothetical protein [Sulfoacidibacillus ferrooxidans]|uniref:Uncharacterized protein n=1 Tax=Sulfoacidibacillus ferrooxidans TaxID=2005001 RepID=A0A9X2AG42_9BACL|nr:hypothetical protein [Sulfoacidibacillus ferrooxidans]MCI0184751.1 hypothetical protein [Sulfoacidibacillus ferrooxidans]